jgi:serine/threonine protein kinase
MDPADAADGKRRTQAWMGSPEPPAAAPAPGRSKRWVPAALPSYPQGRAAGAIVAGRYRLVRELGQGTLTETWEATHVELGRDVAIKFLRQTDGVSEQMVEEARAIARIRHPHVVEFSDIGRSEQGETFVVMELLVGQSIEQLLARQRVIPWARAVAIVRQIGEALGAAHQQGIVHRDLRPGNVFLLELPGMGDSRDFVKIVDFGLARAAMSGPTWSYVSPEQCRGEPLDARSDVYAMGCLLFAMITGDPPFVGDPQQVYWQQLNETPKALHERAPRQFIPTELEAIVARCLAKHPAQRFADGRELAAELAALAQFGLASTLGVPAQDPSASGARPMGFAGRPAPKDARELTNSYKPINEPIVDDEPDEPPQPLRQVHQPSNVPASAPPAAQASMSPPAIVAVTLVGVVTVVGMGIGMYWVVNRLIRAADQTEQREAPTPANEQKLEQPAQPTAPQPAASHTPAQTKPAAPIEVPTNLTPAPAPAEVTEKSDKKQPSKSAEPKPASEEAPAGPPPEPVSEPKKSKPSIDPDSKANGNIGLDELRDPWD